MGKQWESGRKGKKPAVSETSQSAAELLVEVADQSPSAEEITKSETAEQEVIEPQQDDYDDMVPI